MKNFSRLCTFLLAAYLLAGIAPAYSGQTTVRSVITTVSPSQPMAGEDFYVTTQLIPGGNGQWCTATVRVSVAGITSTDKRVSIHNPNASGQLVFKFNLSSVASGADLTPTVSVSGCGNGSFPGISGGSTPPTLQPTPTPALKLIKSLSGAGKTTVSPGDVVTYKLDYASVGTAEAPSVVLTDALDPRLEILSTAGGSVSGQTITWNFGNLTPGASNSVEVTARVAATAASGSLDNVGRIRATGVAEFASNNVQVIVDSNPNIELTKTIDDDVAQSAVREAGRIVTYRIKYENVGGADADNVVITDRLPDELLGPPNLAGGVSSSYDAGNRIVTWNIGRVARKDSKVVTLTAQIDPSLGNIDFDNTAEATFTGGTATPALANITVAAEPNLEVEKSVQPTLVAPGDTLSYTISYRNIGSIVADSPVIEDQLPGGVEPVPGTYSGVYDAGARILRWTLPDIAPGSQKHSVSYQVTVAPGLPNTDLFNQVTMTASNLPYILTAVATTKVQVRQEPVLNPKKQLAAGSKLVVLNGDQLIYELQVNNDGKEPTAGGITITDSLPPGLIFVSASAGGAETSLGSGVVVWNLADIGANSPSGTVTLEVEIDGSQLNDGDFISNAFDVAAADQFGRQYKRTSNHALVQYNAPPSISVKKVASPPETTPLFPGDTVNYTITATLDSRQGVNDLEIVDRLPVGLEFINSSDPQATATMDAAGTLIRWPVSALTSGSRSVTLQAMVKSGLAPGTALTNRASGNYAANSLHEVAPNVTHHVSDAAVSLTKSRPADQAEVIDGEEITYTINYLNKGKIPLTGIQLTDTLPAGLTYVSATPAPSNIAAGTTTSLQWNLSSLDAGKANSVTVTARVDGVGPGIRLTNQAEINTNEAQPDTAKASTVVREAPRLILTKTSNASTVHPGDAIEFTLSYENQGRGEAQNVSLTDSFPTELTFANASDQVMPVSDTITWDLGNLAPGASGTKVIRATVPAGTYTPAIDITNRANIVSDKTSATAAATITVTDLPAFTVKKKADRDHASPGDTLLYTLQYDKTGGPASKVTLLDTLPPELSYVSGSSSSALSAKSDIGAGILIWELGDIAGGTDSGLITFSARLAPVLKNGTLLVNQAVIGSAQTGVIYSNSVNTKVDSNPVLTIKKVPSVTSLLSPTSGAGVPGDSITYTITAENTGNAVATNVTITDSLPAELVIDATSTTANVTGQLATWTLSSLAPGAPATVTIAARVANDVPDKILRNTASIQTTMPGVGGAVSAAVNTPVQGQPVLELEKTVSAPVVLPGKQLVYTLTYRNIGTSISGPISIEDLLPPQTSFVSASDGGAPSGNGHVLWTSLPALKPNEPGSVTVTVEVDPVVVDGTPLRNVATAWEGPNTQNAVQATILGKPALVSSAPLLVLDKSVENNATTVTAGGDVTFNIKYRNVGSDAATNVVIIDTLQPGLSLVQASGQYKQSGNTLTWTLPTMAAKTSGTLKITARADTSLADGKILTNTANIVSTLQPLPTVNGSDTASVTVLDAALTLVKNVDKATVQSGISSSGTPGGLLSYTLTYQNVGNSAATSTVIADVLPANTRLVSAWPNDKVRTSGNIVYWDLGTVPAKTPSGTVGLVVEVQDDLRDGLLIHNTASIDSDTTVKTPARPVNTPVTSDPILTITKSSTVSQVTPGQTYAYDITVTNVGSDTAEGVRITDTLPLETTLVSATGGGVPAGGDVVWDIATVHGSIGPNSSVTVHVKVTADSVITNGTPLLNIASVTGTNRMGRAIPPASSTLLLPVSSSPVLVIDYNVDKPVVQAGGALLYTIRVRNTGNDIATNASVSAILPPDTTPQSITSGGTFVNQTANWTIGSLPPSGSIELQYSVFVASGIPDGTGEGSLSSISASNAPTNTVSAFTVIGAQPLLTVTKSGPNSVNAGDQITYTIDYFNQGNGSSSNTVIEDVLPPGTTNPQPDNGGSASAGVVQWNLGALAPLTGGRVSVTVDTVSGIADGTSIDNISVISGSNAQSASSQASTIERSHTELVVTISAGQDPVASGTQEVFTVTWANTGNQDTTNALVTATLPSDTVYTPASATNGGNFDSSTGLITWAVGSLPAGVTGTATFAVDVNAPLLDGTVLKSVASITADEGLPKSQSAPFMVSSSPVWVVSKSTQSAAAGSGGLVTFNITLQNLGNEQATGVVVTDTMPAGLKLVSADNGAIVDTATNTATWNIGTVAPGAPVLTLSFQA
ncbi:MAG: hypothetical protein ABJK20_07725, partial [Halieaceae bacterium]